MVNSRNMKMTPVGLIPEDWEVIQLADYIVDINDGPFGSNLKSEHYTLDREVRIIQLGNVGDDGWNNENIKYTTFEHASTLKRCIVPYGTIIIAKMMPAGRAIICPSTEPAYIQGSDVIKVVFTDSIDKDFFIYLTKSKAYLEQIESGVQGSTRARTNIGKIKSLKLPLPSVEEQNRIAGALLSVDKMIRALDEAIAKKRQIKEGLMQQLLTGKTRLPGFNDEWKDYSLGEFSQIVMGQSPSSSYYNDKGEGLPLIQGNADLKNRKSFIRIYTSMITKTCEAGDIIMSVRAPVGAVGKSSYKSCLGRGVCAIKASSDFLYHYLVYNENNWGQYSKGSTFDSINGDDLKAVVLHAPQSIEEQNAIASILSKCETELFQLENKRDKYCLIKQGMMQELLTGKTRLI